MSTGLFLVPVGGALIGWYTNVLAIQLLFRPHRPIRIPGTQILIQGLLPRRRKELAQTIAKTLEENLLSMSDIISVLWNEDKKAAVITQVESRLGSIINAKFHRFMPQRASQFVTDTIIGHIRADVFLTIEEMVNQYTADVKEVNIIRPMVQQKIDELDLIELENLIRGVSASEIKYIAWIGGFIGFLIGLLQVALILSFGNIP